MKVSDEVAEVASAAVELAGGLPWQEAKPLARAALEAAYPHIRAAVLAEVVTKLVESGQPLAAAIVTTLEQQP